LAQQLVRLPVRFDEMDVPLWADSAADYKDAVGQFRSQVRGVSYNVTVKGAWQQTALVN
jgi:hypothetical protein